MTPRRDHGLQLAREWRRHRAFIVGWAGFALLVVTATLVLLNPETAVSSFPLVDAGGQAGSDPLSEDAAVAGEPTEQVLSVGEISLRSLSIESADAAAVLSGEAQVPVEQMVFTNEYTAGQPQPSQSAIDASLDSFVTILGRAGYRGSIHIEATAFVLYRGTAPEFGTEVVVTASPATAGAHENLARQQAALNQQTNAGEPLPDLEQGAVWIGESVAYGRAAGPQPHEWVAMQLEDEFYVVSIDHRDTKTVVGPESMIALSTSVISQIRELGLTTVQDHVLSSQFARESPQDASIVWTIFSTRCPSGVPQTVCARPLLDSSE